MNPWKLGFVLPVILHVGFDTEAAAVRSTGREPVVTQVCGNDALDNVTRVMCTVTARRGRGQVCVLAYQHGRGSTGKCDSRFTLRAENHTVFLHLTNLAPGDSGRYSCSCSHAHGVSQRHLDVTVEGGGRSSSSALTMLSTTTVVGNAAALVLVSGFVLGLVLRRKHCRQRAEAGCSGLPACGAFCSLVLTTKDKAEPGDLYVNLRQLSADVCQKRGRKANPASNAKGREATGRDPDQIYVNI